MKMQVSDDTTLNYKFFLEDSKYKIKSKFIDYWNQMQEFYEGKQYPITTNPKLPKAVFNFCKFLILNKASKIIGTPYTIVFQTAGNDVSTLSLQHYYKFILLTMQDDVFNYEVVENALIYGQDITYIQYDEDYTTFKAFKKGGFKEVHIDPRKFAVANPHELDIQKQEWIEYWGDESVASVKKMCLKMKGESDKDFKERVEKILPDDYLPEDVNKTDREDVAYGLCTIYTRFFRDTNNEVLFQVATKDVNLFDPKPLSPDTYLAIKKFEADEETAELNGDKIADYTGVAPAQIDTQLSNPKNISDKEYQKELFKFSMYPFCVYRPTNRMNNFYGISELQDYIGNQQIINALPSYMAYDIKTNASGKYVAKKDSLKGQKINDDAGQIITDYSTTNGYGVKRLEGQTMATNIMEYVNSMFGLMRTISGTTEVFTGEMSKNLSGSAISLLQEQGNTIIEQQQKDFNNGYCVDKAKIIFQFIMHYVDEDNFLYERSEAEYEEENTYRKQLMDMDEKNNPAGFADIVNNPKMLESKYPKVNRVESENFSTKSLRNKIFFVQPKSGRGVKYSEIIQADFLQQLLMNGGLEKYSADQLNLMLEVIPLVDDTTKANLKVQVEKMRNSQLSQAQGQIQDLQQQLSQAAMLNQKYQQVVDYLKTYNAELGKQFQQQIDAAKLQVSARDEVMRNIATKQGQSTSQGSEVKPKPTSITEMVKEM